MSKLPPSLSSDIPTTSFLRVNSCGSLLCTDQDHKIYRPNGRSDYLLVYIVRGMGYVIIDNKKIPVHQKQAFILHPHEPQYYCFYKKDNTLNYWVHFNGTQCESIINDLHLDSINILRLNTDTPDIEETICRMCHEYIRKKPCYEQICSGLLITALSLISRSLFYSGIKENNGKSDLIDQIITEFYVSLQNPITIDNLAKKFSISTNSLIREFKKSTGMTPAQYVIDMRMKKAEELLLFSNYSINQIAEFLGYQNYSYFSRLFKKHRGVSPNDFRAHRSI